MTDAATPVPAETRSVTRGLPKFLAAMVAKDHPLVLDLGPVVGANVTFFGEHVGCRTRVENLTADIDAHAREGTLDRLPAFLGRRFDQDAGHVDGILCWDILDYLDRPSAHALAGALTRLLAPDGRLLGFFSTTDAADAGYTKYIVEDASTLRHRPYPALVRRHRGFLTGDIIKLFTGLQVTDSFLMKNSVREMLFRNAARRV